MSNIIVGISDQKVCRAPDTLTTYALGSCVGICLLDKETGVAGLAHIMLPDSSIMNNGASFNIFKFADTGIVNLYNEMLHLGARKGKITAKIAGGATMFTISGNKFNIGERNVSAVRMHLSKLNISVIAQDTGLNYGRTIIFDSASGDLQVKSSIRGYKTI